MNRVYAMITGVNLTLCFVQMALGNWGWATVSAGSALLTFWSSYE